MEVKRIGACILLSLLYWLFAFGFILSTAVLIALYGPIGIIPAGFFIIFCVAVIIARALELRE